MAQTVRMRMDAERAEKVKDISEVTEANVMDPRWLEAVPMVHDGVRCVACSSSPIVGRRLECDLCYDYNLCEDCYTTTTNKDIEPQKLLNLQRSLSSPAPQQSPQIGLQFPFSRKPLQHAASLQLSLLTDPEEGGPMKQEHQSQHSFTDVVKSDRMWSRALRLRKGVFFKTIIGEEKLEALNWVMDKEKSTQKTASYLLDMKGKNDKELFITNSDMKKKTVLIKALRNCWEDLALSLIRREVDIYEKDEKKRTALMWACKTNLHIVVEKLLERNTHGAKYINEINDEKMTALAIAVANKNEECIKHILHCGVPVELYCHDNDKKLLPFSYENIKDFLDAQINQKKPTWSSSSVMSNKTSDESLHGLTEDENMIELNYDNIVSEKSELSVINDFVHLRKENISLLKHPLLQAMVMMKWMTFQWLWLIELILQFLFTILMFTIGTSLLKMEPNNCSNKTMVQIRQEDEKNFHQETAVITILASLLWIFYFLVEIVQFSFSTIEIVQNLTVWKRVFVENEPENETKKQRGLKRAKISKIIRNFYFPIPTYLKEMENWLQLVIITIRYNI